MYYENYEDYMRSVLGYPIDTQNTYETYGDYSQQIYEPMNYTNRYDDDIMRLYPEIYRIAMPMVQKICEANTKPITRELIDKMTEEIYLNLEGDEEVTNVVNVTVNTPRDTNGGGDGNKASRSGTVPASAISSKANREIKAVQDNSRENMRASNSNVNLRDSEREILKESENRVSRQRRNPILQDLLKILILNQILGGNRPPIYPPHHPHPPFPGPRPPMPPHRPPVRPPFPRDDRYYNEYYNF